MIARSLILYTSRFCLSYDGLAALYRDADSTAPVESNAGANSSANQFSRVSAETVDEGFSLKNVRIRPGPERGLAMVRI